MKPILFNTEMVRAILEGRKTVTRRVVKPDQLLGLQPDRCPNKLPEEFIKEKPLLFKPYCDMSDNELVMSIFKPPYEVNDILYVRETWIPKESEENGKLVKGFAYKADFTGYESMFAWRPSIHMPKEAARIFLKVTDVRVERLQDITREQVHKEGVPSRTAGENTIMLRAETETGEVIEQNGIEMCHVDFATLWDSTIKKDQLKYYSWNANPYVWVIEFERVEKPAAVTERI